VVIILLFLEDVEEDFEFLYGRCVVDRCLFNDKEGLVVRFMLPSRASYCDRSLGLGEGVAMPNLGA
jgi:hypothetical protein